MKFTPIETHLLIAILDEKRIALSGTDGQRASLCSALISKIAYSLISSNAKPKAVKKGYKKGLGGNYMNKLYSGK